MTEMILDWIRWTKTLTYIYVYNRNRLKYMILLFPSSMICRFVDNDAMNTMFKKPTSMNIYLSHLNKELHERWYFTNIDKTISFQIKKKKN